MKDILTRVTNAEKDFLTYMRSLTAFELKDLLNQYLSLVALSKIAETGLDITLVEGMNQQLERIFNEREFYVLKKLQKKPSVSSIAAKVKAVDTIENNDDVEDIEKYDAKGTVSQINKQDEDAANPEEPTAEKNDSELPDVNNNIVDKFISRNYRNYIFNVNKTKKPTE